MVNRSKNNWPLKRLPKEECTKQERRRRRRKCVGVMLETKGMGKGQRKFGTVTNLTSQRSEFRLSWVWAQIGRGEFGEVKMVTLRHKYQRVAHQKLLYWNSQISFNFLVSTLTREIWLYCIVEYRDQPRAWMLRYHRNIK